MHAEGQFVASGTEGFRELRWTVSEPEANVVIIHGYREHCGRYAHVAEFLNEHQYNVFSYDHRGHGKSPGKRGRVDRFPQFVDDLDDYLQHLQPDLGDLPTLVIAHSMGGLIFTRYLETRAWRPRAAVFSGAFLAVKDVSPALLAVADILSSLAPWLPVAALDPKAISRDPEEVRKYETDPLNVSGMIDARSGAELNKAVSAARAETQLIDIPAYILHGKEDALVPYEASVHLHDTIRSADKTLKLYEGGFHEQFNDLEKERVLGDMRDWMDAHRG